MLFLEAILGLFTQRHDRGHVRFVEGRERGRGLLRLNKPLRDALADAGHARARLTLRLW